MPAAKMAPRIARGSRSKKKWDKRNIELKELSEGALATYKKSGGDKKGAVDWGMISGKVGRYRSKGAGGGVEKQLTAYWKKENSWHWDMQQHKWMPGPKRVFEEVSRVGGDVQFTEKTGSGKEVMRYVKHKGKYYKFNINKKVHAGRPFGSVEDFKDKYSAQNRIFREQKEYSPDMPEYKGNLGFMDQKKKSWYQKNPFARTSKTRQQKKKEATADRKAREKFEKKESKGERRREASEKRQDYNERAEARKDQDAKRKKRQEEWDAQSPQKRGWRTRKHKAKKERKRKEVKEDIDEREARYPKDPDEKRSKGVGGFLRRTAGAMPGVSRTRWGRERRSHGRKKRRVRLAEAEKEEELRGREHKIEQARRSRRTERTRSRAEERAWKRGDYI